MSDSDVFIISVVSNTDSAEAIQQAIYNAGINSIRVQDVIFGLDEPRSIDTEKIISASNLTCSAATVSSSLRAAFFAAQSILSFDVDVLIVRWHGNQHFDRIIVGFTGCGRQMESDAACASRGAFVEWN